MIDFETLNNKFNRVLVILAHPDDFDVMFAGTMAKFAKNGKEVFLLLLTKGGRGSRNDKKDEDNLAAERLAEQKEAFKILGINPNNIIAFDIKDGEIDNSFEMIGRVVYQIRKIKPDLVATFDPSVYYHKSLNGQYYFVQHRDHRHAGILALDAVYPFSRDRSFFPEHFVEGLEPHHVYDLLLVGNNDDANCEVDISDVIDLKKKSLLAHKTQFNPEIVSRIIESRRTNDKYTEIFKYLNLMH